ncbi:MAG: hypothetical protein K2L91_02250 [Duncaniella sp.]|nr:hypothetical protein [Duncaniella sp.]MDE6327327.1 hypothetical protein [Duncaniella sp.]
MVSGKCGKIFGLSSVTLVSVEIESRIVVSVVICREGLKEHDVKRSMTVIVMDFIASS